MIRQSRTTFPNTYRRTPLSDSVQLTVSAVSDADSYATGGLYSVSQWRTLLRVGQLCPRLGEP